MAASGCGPTKTPWDNLPYRTISLPFGALWFLLTISAYFKLKDRVA